jgi:hypothetical protein
LHLIKRSCLLEPRNFPETYELLFWVKVKDLLETFMVSTPEDQIDKLYGSLPEFRKIGSTTFLEANIFETTREYSCSRLRGTLESCIRSIVSSRSNLGPCQCLRAAGKFSDLFGGASNRKLNGDERHIMGPFISNNIQKSIT